MKKLNIIIVPVVALLLLFSGKATATEQASYVVVKKYRDFELRHYDAYLVAETEVDGDFENAATKAFQRLAGYIGGNNKKREEISMTAPVEQRSAEEKGEKIAMTVPVTQAPASDGKNKGTYIISFVMPSKYTMKNIPEPSDPKVKIRAIPAKLVAARQYSGSWSENNYRENESILLDAVEKAGLKITGQPVYARYNPPWSLWFMRRNEVLIEIDEPVPGPESSASKK